MKTSITNRIIILICCASIMLNVYMVVNREICISTYNQDIVNLNEEMNRVNEKNRIIEEKVKQYSNILIKSRDTINDNNTSDFEVKKNSIDIKNERLLISFDNLCNGIDGTKKILGEPVDVSKYENAHGGGERVELIYSGITLTYVKYDKNEELVHYKIKDIKYATQCGVTIGETKENVLTVYGKDYSDYYEDENQISIFDKPSQIIFLLQDNKVKEIDVYLKYE